MRKNVRKLTEIKKCQKTDQKIQPCEKWLKISHGVIEQKFLRKIRNDIFWHFSLFWSNPDIFDFGNVILWHFFGLYGIIHESDLDNKLFAHSPWIHVRGSIMVKLFHCAYWMK